VSDLAPPAHPDVDIVRAETAFKGFLQLDVFRFRHRQFGGEWSGPRQHELLRVGPAVAVLLYDPVRDAVVLVEQVRLGALAAGASPWQLEVPAGRADADAPLETAAIREVREETGLMPLDALVPIQRYLPSSGVSDESVLLYCAPVDSAIAGGIHGLREEGEDIRVVVKASTEVEALLDAGMIENGHSLVALYWLLRHRERLRRLWSDPVSHAAASRGRADCA
jgi:ADP-ribose pyrophosphatase